MTMDLMVKCDHSCPYGTCLNNWRPHISASLCFTEATLAAGHFKLYNLGRHFRVGQTKSRAHICVWFSQGSFSVHQSLTLTQQAFLWVLKLPTKTSGWRENCLFISFSFITWAEKLFNLLQLFSNGSKLQNYQKSFKRCLQQQNI